MARDERLPHIDLERFADAGRETHAAISALERLCRSGEERTDLCLEADRECARLLAACVRADGRIELCPHGRAHATRSARGDPVREPDTRGRALQRRCRRLSAARGAPLGAGSDGVRTVLPLGGNARPPAHARRRGVAVGASVMLRATVLATALDSRRAASSLPPDNRPGIRSGGTGVSVAAPVSLRIPCSPRALNATR
jgi:hypothetical protein